jgi:hypothetical protein
MYCRIEENVTFERTFHPLGVLAVAVVFNEIKASRSRPETILPGRLKVGVVVAPLLVIVQSVPTRTG